MVRKDIASIKVVINGAGSAGIAIAKHIMNLGVKNLILCDSVGIICEGDARLNSEKAAMAQITNREHLTGKLADAMKDSDVFIGVSAPNIVSEEMVASMNKDAIVLAMSNPTP
ncbi:MAG TPA: NAD-dependent malic enzyme, partial [Ruminococcaceae bacterium]|nr:NAD-dependent malic enzyme [Oscillospiraceae bacterium]